MGNKYPTRCSHCDWTHTDQNSVRVYVNGHEVFSESGLFNLEADGSFDRTGLVKNCINPIGTLKDCIDPIGTWSLICQECGHELVEVGKMNNDWYIRWEATNEISGPMTKEEALEHTGDGSGMAFSEGVFEPYHVPADTTSLVNELLALGDGQERSSGDVGDVGKRAAEMLVILSRPREVTATVKGGVFEVETIAQGVHLVVRDYDTGGVDGDEIEEDSGGSHLVQEYGGYP